MRAQRRWLSLGFALWVIALCMLVPGLAQAHSNGVGSAEFGGNPAATVGCDSPDGCHNSSGGTSDSSVSITANGASAGNPVLSGGVLYVNAGAVITLNFNVGGGAGWHGFNVSTDGGNPASEGTLSTSGLDGSTQQIPNGAHPASTTNGGRNEVTHTGTRNATSFAWIFNWSAPGATCTTTRLYAWDNSVDHNSSTSHDIAARAILDIQTRCNNGTFCGSNANTCSSGVCADGYCCNSGSCTGTCQGCAVAGSEGFCTSSATPQHGGCGGSAPCAGFCSGFSGSCSYPGGGTVCSAASCSGSPPTAHTASVCDGAGSCTGSSATDCSPFTCNGNVCNGACTLDTQCVSGDYCCQGGDCCAVGGGSCGGVSSGGCNPSKSQGQQCTNDHECSGGLSCVDGVCCNTAGAGTARCGGECESCISLGHVGTCFQTTGAPLGGRAACANTFAGCGGSCGTQRNACDYPATSCRTQSCSDVTHQQINPASCSAGSCPVTPLPTSCGLYKCVGNSCGSTCAGDTDCVTGAFCDTTATPHVCNGVFGNGHVCGANNQCSSNFCVDGVCCDKACGGQCEACDVTPGTCANVPSGQPHGSRATCTGVGSAPCGGSCNGATNACFYPPVSTDCRAASCTAGVATSSAKCNGAGLCPAPATTPCSPYVCGAPGCKTSCGADSDCISTDYCSGGACVAKHAPGFSCSATSECASGFCVDGVCCDRACNGQCEACNLAPSPGTCGNVPSGGPRGTRAACNGGGTCGGVCNGSGPACFYTTVNCRAASCASGVGTLAANCDGAGFCPSPTTATCAPYVCGATACKGACSGDADCDAADFCSGGACTPRRAAGAACSAIDQCTSGFCVDGVCCDRACNAQCEACDVTPGSCTNVSSGQPHGTRAACTGAGTSPCGGSCGGAPACIYAGTSTSCRASTCTSGTATSGANCDGAGTCPPPTSSTCAPYTCGAATCKISCSTDTDCAGGLICVAGVCSGKSPNGTLCTSGASCNSGNCVDGVCCDQPCGGSCQACDVGGAVGTCTNVSGAPHGGRAACGGSGTCAGACNGSSASCVFPTSSCRAASCASAVATTAANCDGAGNCPAAVTTPCPPYVCGGVTCKTSCTSDADCIGGDFCIAGKCNGKTGNGLPCTSGVECNSGVCADGVCCDKACNGQCEGCNTPGKAGTCSAVTGAPVTGRTACAGDGTLCSGSCDGSNRTSCAFPLPTTSCRPPTCAGGIATVAANCTGTGTCPPLKTQDCAPNTCNAASTACAGGCALDSDCTAGSFCSAGVCKPKSITGTACGGTNECASGFCVDGFCCDKACNEQCAACNRPGSLGTCGPSTGKPVSGRTPCTSDGSACGGACDGIVAASCTYPGASTNCRAASCASGVAVVAASCDGAGACPPATNRVCAPFACSGTICGGGCVLDSDCAAGNRCSGGVCVPLATVGKACTAPTDCATGSCVDGVCCDRPCSGQCEACDVLGNTGTCVTVRSGTPHGSRPACGLVGACAGECNGTDPLSCGPSSTGCGGDSGTVPDAVASDGVVDETSEIGVLTDGSVDESGDATTGEGGADATGTDAKSDAKSDAGAKDGSVGGDTSIPDGSITIDGQPNENGGCACTTTGSSQGSSRGLSALSLLGLAVAVSAIRRRRRAA